MKQVFLFLVLVLILAGSSCAQDHWEFTPVGTANVEPEPIPEPEEPECDHTSNEASRFEVVRLLPPVKIRNFDLRNIEYTHEDKFGIHVGSLSANAESVFPPDIWKEYKNKFYWVLYCSICKHIYTIAEVTKEQIKEPEKPKRKKSI
jgi:hypothetical protein